VAISIKHADFIFITAESVLKGDFGIMAAKYKLLVGFILLEIIDFLPFPVTSLVAIYIVLKKPLWFRDWVLELYRGR